MRGNPVRGCRGRGTRQSHGRERELRAVTEGKASGYSWSGEGRESWSGQHKRECGTRPDHAEPPGVMVRGWIYSKCGQQPSEGNNNLNYTPQPCFGLVRMSEAEEQSDHGPGPCLDTGRWAGRADWGSEWATVLGEGRRVWAGGRADSWGSLSLVGAGGRQGTQNV